MSGRCVRRRLAERYVSRILLLLPSPILYADHVPETGVKLFHKICEMDLEGIVAKRKTAPYREKTLWIKIRNPNYSQKEGRAELFQARWR